MRNLVRVIVRLGLIISISFELKAYILLLRDAKNHKPPYDALHTQKSIRVKG